MYSGNNNNVAVVTASAERRVSADESAVLGANNNNDNGDNNRPEFQCDCVCSCCCQCYPAEKSALQRVTSESVRKNDNKIDNTHKKVDQQDPIVRRKRRKGRAKSGNFEHLLSSSEGSPATNGSQNRRNSAYCVCKLEIKIVW